MVTDATGISSSTVLHAIRQMTATQDRRNFFMAIWFMQKYENILTIGVAFGEA
jgi:hypothetical protein